MSKYTLCLYGISDDLAYLTLFDENTNLLEEEYGCFNSYKKFSINNGYFSIFVRAPDDDGWGWQVGVMDLNEEFDGELSKQFSISIDLPPGAYSPTLRIVSDEPIIIDGIYGDMKSKVIQKIVEVLGVRNDEATKLAIELEKIK